MGGKQPISTKGSLRRDDPFAKGKGKVGYEASEAQSRGSVLKCGSKKLWNALFPPSSGCRQGGRSPSEPLTLERLSLASDDLPKEDSFEVGTQLERSFSASPSRSSGSRKRCLGIGKECRRQVETRIEGLFLRLLFFQNGRRNCATSLKVRQSRF